MVGEAVVPVNVVAMVRLRCAALLGTEADTLLTIAEALADLCALAVELPWA